MNSNSSLIWMETIDRQSQFQFDLKRDYHAIICTIKNLFSNCRKRTNRYLIKKFVSGMNAWTTFHQANEKNFLQMISYLDGTLKARGCGLE